VAEAGEVTGLKACGMRAHVAKVCTQTGTPISTLRCGICGFKATTKLIFVRNSNTLPFEPTGR
jgi:hypothetical protein